MIAATVCSAAAGSCARSRAMTGSVNAAARDGFGGIRTPCCLLRTIMIARFTFSSQVLIQTGGQTGCMTPVLPAYAPRRTAASVLLGGATRLAGLAATPLVPADYLDLVSPLRSGADLR